MNTQGFDSWNQLLSWFINLNFLDDNLDLLYKVKDDVRSLMLIGHNPGLTQLVNFFTNINLYNLPTTGIVVINFIIDKWNNIRDSKGNIELIKFPKELNL